MSSPAKLVEFIIHSEQKNLTLDFVFDTVTSNGKVRIPSFIQKIDSSSQTLTFFFLETRTTLPLGSYNLKTPQLTSLSLSPYSQSFNNTKKSFLALSVKFQSLPGITKFPYRKVTQGRLRITLMPLNQVFAAYRVHPGSVPQKASEAVQPPSPSSSTKNGVTTPTSDQKLTSQNQTVPKPSPQQALENKKEPKNMGVPLENALQTGIKIDTQTRSSPVVRVFKLSAPAESVVIGPKPVRFRTDASEKTPSLGLIPAGTWVRRSDVIGDWSQIEYKGKKGFVKTALLGKTAAEIKAEAAAQKARLDSIQNERKLELLRKVARSESLKLEQQKKAQAKQKLADSVKLAAKNKLEAKQKAELLEKQNLMAREAAKKEAAQIKKQQDSLIKAEKVALQAKIKQDRQDSIALYKTKLKAEKAKQDSIKNALRLAEIQKKAKELEIQKQAQAKVLAQKAEEERIRKEQVLLAQMAARQKLIEEQEAAKKAERERIRYSSFGKRDPFTALEASLQDPDAIDLSQLNLVGVIWGADPIAILEHRTEPSISFTLKQGDPVPGGRVDRISRDEIFFRIKEFGVTRSFSISLIPVTEVKPNAAKN